MSLPNIMVIVVVHAEEGGRSLPLEPSPAVRKPSRGPAMDG